jgi:hypothetical protein
MRGKSGPILFGVGAFLLVAALLVKFYAYPTLAVAPHDPNSETVLTADEATVFDTGTLSEVSTSLTSTVKTVGDKDAAEEEGGDTRVYTSATSTRDSEGNIRSRSVDRVAFDAHTGEAINCCGEFEESVEGEREEIEHQGLTVKFPFNTQKESYDFWDSSLQETVEIEYQGTEDVGGLETYKFQHSIEPTEVSTLEVPASVVGAEGDENVTAQRMYSNVRTLWVEPETGVVIDRQEEQNSTLRYDGEDQVTVTQATLSYSDETVQNSIDEYSGKSSLLGAVRTWVPLVLGILGLLLLVAGVLLTMRSRPSGETGYTSHRGDPALTR